MSWRFEVTASNGTRYGPVTVTESELLTPPWTVIRVSLVAIEKPRKEHGDDAFAGGA